VAQFFLFEMLPFFLAALLFLLDRCLAFGLVAHTPPITDGW
jgi:hypothetical protein